MQRVHCSWRPAPCPRPDFRSVLLLGSRARLQVLIATVILICPVLASCHGASEQPTDLRRPASNATATPLLPTTILALPTFDFETFERLLYELRGTPVVVNIWASWCGPCRQEAPVLTAAVERYGDRVQFVGVDMQDDRAPAASYLNRYAVTYPSVADPSGEIHDRLGFVGLPDTVFYGPDGQIVDTWSGPLTSDALRTNIETLLRKPTSSASPTS